MPGSEIKQFSRAKVVVVIVVVVIVVVVLVVVVVVNNLCQCQLSAKTLSTESERKEQKNFFDL